MPAKIVMTDLLEEAEILKESKIVSLNCSLSPLTKGVGGCLSDESFVELRQKCALEVKRALSGEEVKNVVNRHYFISV